MCDIDFGSAATDRMVIFERFVTDFPVMICKNNCALKCILACVTQYSQNGLNLMQSWEKTVDCYSPGQGLMPASFKVLTVFRDGDEANGTEEILDPDFGEAAIGRVAPVDSGESLLCFQGFRLFNCKLYRTFIELKRFCCQLHATHAGCSHLGAGLWWIILLRAYAKCTGDTSLQERVDFQIGIKMIMKVCLADGFDMFPTLLVTDGPCMIDRRMGIHGHPLEIQVCYLTLVLLCSQFHFLFKLQC